MQSDAVYAHYFNNQDGVVTEAEAILSHSLVAAILFFKGGSNKNIHFII